MATRTYSFQLALSDSDISRYFQLRAQIFCQEQGLFDGHDRDEIDQRSYPIVAIAHEENRSDQVVGAVRIYEQAPRLWYGGRLGVHPDFRRVGRIGRGLIQTAVTTANTWGCDRFLATVQRQNVRFFTRLHWQSLEELEILSQPHHLMEADLAHYPADPPAAARPRPALPLLSSPAQQVA